MNDLNFFSVYKRQSSKNQGSKVFLIILLVVVLLLNGLLFFGGRYLFDNIQSQIDQKNAYINDEDTKLAILMAEITKSKLGLISEYRGLLERVDKSINLVRILDSELITEIQQLIPVTTVVKSMTITDNSVSLDCMSAVATDPMDLYHALMASKRYTNIVFTAIVMDPIAGSASYSLSFQVEGGEQP